MKKSKNLIHYFLILDSFGVGINFYLEGYKDYRSQLGGFITLVIYVITIICGIIFSKNLLQRVNPSVSTTSANYPNPEKILYPNNTFFILGITVDSLPFINESIYRPIAYINTKVNGSEELMRQNISVDLCDKVLNEDYKYYDVIKHLNLSNFYCIDLNQNNKSGINNDELYINEFWGNDGFRMLQIKIFNCSAVADDISQCADNDIIKEKLSSPIISYYTLKNYIDTNNYKNPFVRGLQETFYYVSYKKFISATQYLKHVQIHSDKGFLFSEEEIIADHTIDSLIEYSETDQEDGKIFTISIQLTNKIDIYTRTYNKLQDLGAEIGAVYGALHMVLAIIFQFYNNSKLFCDIINNFFLIKEDFTPLNREKKSFVDLKRRFFKDLNLIISLRKSSFVTSHHSRFNNSSNLNKNINLSTMSDLNTTNKNKFSEEILKTTDNLKKEKINFREKNKIFLNRVLTEKKEEDKHKIRIDFTYADRFLCLYLINLCRKKVNRYSYYNFFYKGKDYIISALDITNYLKYNTFLQMLFLINNKETRELFEYVTTPILSSKYIGPRFEVEK
jgi:hypothetical protein